MILATRRIRRRHRRRRWRDHRGCGWDCCYIGVAVARGVTYSVVHVAAVKSSTVAAAIRRDRMDVAVIGTVTGTSTTIDVVV